MHSPQLIPRFQEHFPDIHHERITAHFGDRPVPTSDRQALDEVLAGLKCFYVMCFTNRCGSHFIGHALASQQRLRPAGETLNADTVIKQSIARNFGSFEAYLAWLLGHLSKGSGVAGVKASVGQLIGLYNRGILAALGDRLRMIHIVRADKIEQAVSLHIAACTQQWTSLQTAKSVDVPYAPTVLLDLMASLNRQNAAFQSLFQLFGLAPMEVVYETFMADPERGTRRLGRFLGMPGLRYEPAGIPYAKQADERNVMLKQRLLADFALGSAATVSVGD